MIASGDVRNGLYRPFVHPFSQLQEMGYTNIDAVDASQNMLDKAREKNIYKHLACARVGKEQLQIANGMYKDKVTKGDLLDIK